MTTPSPGSDGRSPTTTEPGLIEARATEVGGITVHRLLPRRLRRTVGAWCFLDHFGPTGPAATPMSVGPHPHIGLQTVTWLIEGEVRHTDSLGNDVTILPGQLNLMSAGYGVAHAEQGVPLAGRTHGAQLWIAQPDGTRNAEPTFDHYAELPTVRVGNFSATVLAGSFFGERSPARIATPIVGVEITGHGRATVPLDPRFEYGVAVLDGPVLLDGTVTGVDVFADLSSGRAHDVVVESVGEARLLLLGGVPFPAPILMWWNFVARTRSEIEDAWQAWSERSLRFGDVVSELDAIDTAPPSWMAK